MQSRRVVFQEVVLAFRKSGVCPGCGGKATRTKKFSQTLNPFNKNSKGAVKTEAEIKGELVSAGHKWRMEPVYHVKCEQ